MKKLAALLLICATVFCSLPIFSVPARASFTGEDKINIVLDPGHGGTNVGASARGVGEKVYSYRLAELIRDELNANGSFNVYFTRTGDYDLELYERAEVANRYNADLLLSLHFDGSTSTYMNGATAYTSVLDRFALTTLSASITSGISSAIGIGDNGVKRRQDNAGYYWNFEKQWDCQDPSLGTLSDYYGIPTWCAKFGIPSAIIEHGFFSNSSDVSKLFAEGAMQKMAKAEAQAIINYYTNHTHVYSAAIQDYASNCVYTGKQSEHCSVCGHRRNVQSLAQNLSNHYWVDKGSTPASCGVDGSVVLECRITQNLADKGWEGQVHTSVEVIPAPQDHSFVMVANVEATHTENGYQTWKCSTCSYSFSETIQAEGHTLEYVGYTAPTCTDPGGDNYKCTSCDHTYTDSVPATGHTFTVTSRTEPTCTETGSEERICSVCSHSESEELSPLGHRFPESSSLAPTCTEDGYNKGSCTVCGETVDETVPATGHTFVIVSQTEATCQTEGSIVQTCSVCSHSETQTTEKTPHSYDTVDTVAPTCEASGSRILVCSLCQSTVTEELPPLGHIKSETATSAENATAFSKGYAEYACANGCGKTFTEEIPAQFSNRDKLLLMGSIAVLIAAILAGVIFVVIRRSKKEEAPSDEKGEAAPAAVPADKSGNEEKDESGEDSENSDEAAQAHSEAASHTEKA